VVRLRGILRQMMPARNLHLGMWMHCQIDRDPTHRVLRLTVTTEVVTKELADDFNRALLLVASRDGPYASIIDLSGVTGTTLSADEVRDFARLPYPVPGGRTRVVVAKETLIFGFARMAQLCRDFMGAQFRVVQSLEDAYAMLGVRPEDFTERVFPIDRAA